MKTDDFKLDEIVFEHRIKDYGAFELRKSYNKTISKAIMVTVSIFFLGISIPLIANYINKDKKPDFSTVISTTIDLTQPEIEKQEIKIPEPPMQKLDEARSNYAPIVVEGEVDVEIESLQEVAANNTVTPNEGSGNVVVVEKVKEPEVIIEKPEPVTFIVVEEMPEFPGGDEGRIRFLANNIKYPKMARETNIQGTVHVEFVVNEIGKIVELKLIRGIGGGCDEEALRVFTKMPNWKPGKQNGVAVRVRFTMPVKFVLG